MKASIRVKLSSNNGLVQDDVSREYWDSLTPTRLRSGEEMLWKACLDEALSCLRGNCDKHKNKYESHGYRNKQETLRWFRSDDEHVGSFVFVCDVLGLDYRAVRKVALGR